MSSADRHCPSPTLLILQLVCVISSNRRWAKGSVLHKRIEKERNDTENELQGLEGVGRLVGSVMNPRCFFGIRVSLQSFAMCA
jgi:hypothetical protein